jgi:hypothetical protein
LTCKSYVFTHRDKSYFLQNLKKTDIDLVKHLDVLIKATKKSDSILKSHIDVLYTLVSLAFVQEHLEKDKHDSFIGVLQSKRKEDTYTPKAVRYNFDNVETDDLIIERLII